MLSWHFDFHYNDDYPIDGKVIIMILKRLAGVVKWCVMMQLPIVSICWWYGAVYKNPLTWT